MSGSVCPSICLAVGQYHTKHRVQVLCGGVSSWIGVGRERKRGVRMGQGCWPAHLEGGVGVGQDGEGAGRGVAGQGQVFRSAVLPILRVEVLRPKEMNYPVT